MVELGMSRSLATVLTKLDENFIRAIRAAFQFDWERLGSFIKEAAKTYDDGPVQTLVAGTTINSENGLVLISSAGNITLTSTPTISAGYHGRHLLLMNTGSYNITLQDNVQLAGSTLRMEAGSVPLSPLASIQFVYISGQGWVQTQAVIL